MLWLAPNYISLLHAHKNNNAVRELPFVLNNNEAKFVLNEGPIIV